MILDGRPLRGKELDQLKDFLESAREEEALCYCEC